MAYISCLPAESNSYVIVPNLSLPGLLFNLPPWITFRKVTAIQLEPYQRCTRSPDSRLSRMGHKSRNCTSQSAITIMNNWGGDKKKVAKHLCIFQSLTPFLGGIKKGEQLEEWQQGKGEEKAMVFKSVPKSLPFCLKKYMSKTNDWY